MGRISLILTVLAMSCIAASASAQTGRAMGTVRDTDGKAIQGATIRAINPEGSPPPIVSTSDRRGRWAMLGMRIATYDFVVEAPGFLPVYGSAAVRTSGAPPITFTLARDPGPLPGALPSNIQAQLSAANMLRDQGRLDQAITAYEEIRTRSPKLTSVNLVIGNVYRQKAAQESGPAARRALLDRAIESYLVLLNADGENERVKRELESLRAEAASLLP